MNQSQLLYVLVDMQNLKRSERVQPDGCAHSYAASVSYLAMAIWAYEELVHGVNWFRRLLGLAYVILLVVRVADALHA
jgi:hypothetical protein